MFLTWRWEWEGEKGCICPWGAYVFCSKGLTEEAIFLSLQREPRICGEFLRVSWGRRWHRIPFLSLHEHRGGDEQLPGRGMEGGRESIFGPLCARAAVWASIFGAGEWIPGVWALRGEGRGAPWRRWGCCGETHRVQLWSDLSRPIWFHVLPRPFLLIGLDHKSLPPSLMPVLSSQLKWARFVVAAQTSTLSIPIGHHILSKTLMSQASSPPVLRASGPRTYLLCMAEVPSRRKIIEHNFWKSLNTLFEHYHVCCASRDSELNPICLLLSWTIRNVEGEVQAHCHQGKAGMGSSGGKEVDTGGWFPTAVSWQDFLEEIFELLCFYGVKNFYRQWKEEREGGALIVLNSQAVYLLP